MDLACHGEGVEMAGNIWWLLTLPCVLLALLLIGSPEFALIERPLDPTFAPASMMPVPSGSEVAHMRIEDTATYSSFHAPCRLSGQFK